MSYTHQEFDVFAQAKKLTEGEARACIEVIANRFAVIEAVNSTLKAERDEQFRAASQLADGVVRISAERDALRAQLAAVSKPIRRPKEVVDYERHPGAEEIDLECIPLCKALNPLTGIQTISSCCGHGYAPFRIYFTAEYLEDLKPVLAAIDEDENWQIRTSWATGGEAIYHILDGPKGEVGYAAANELAARIAQVKP